LVIMPLPTIPDSSLDLPPIPEGRGVIQPVVNESGLAVMTTGTLAHEDGLDVTQVGDAWGGIGVTRHGGRPRGSNASNRVGRQQEGPSITRWTGRIRVNGLEIAVACAGIDGVPSLICGSILNE